MRTQKFEKILKCQLTEAEKLQAGSEMADAQAEAADLENQLASVKSQFKANIDAQTAIIGVKASLIRSGYEHRKVDCERTFDMDRKLVIEKRLDTGDVVGSRMMTAEETQQELDLNDDEPGEDKAD